MNPTKVYNYCALKGQSENFVQLAFAMEAFNTLEEFQLVVITIQAESNKILKHHTWWLKSLNIGWSLSRSKANDCGCFVLIHYDDVRMGAIASQITSLTIVYSIVYSDADQRKHQSSASLAFVRGIHQGPVNFPHKWPVTRKMFPFDDVIMSLPERMQLSGHGWQPSAIIDWHPVV